MTWKVISTPGEYNRYKMQPGVNVIQIHEPIADPQESAQIEQMLSQHFQQEIQSNRVRFYKTNIKLSDGGGGLLVFFNGKELLHKAIVMGSVDLVAKAVMQGLKAEEQGQ